MIRAPWLVGALAALATAGSTAAAAAPARFSLTLFDQPNYRGASVVLEGDRADLGAFAARARSAQVRGAWRLCQSVSFRNHCEVMNGDVPDLAEYNIAGQVASAQLLSAGAARGPATVTAPSSRRYAQATPSRATYGRAIVEEPADEPVYAPEPAAEPLYEEAAAPAPAQALPAPDPRGVFAGRDPSGRPLYFQVPADQGYSSPRSAYPPPVRSYSPPTYAAPAYSPRAYAQPVYPAPRPAYAAPPTPQPQAPQPYADPLRYPPAVDAPPVRSYPSRPAPRTAPVPEPVREPPPAPVYAAEPAYASSTYHQLPAEESSQAPAAVVGRRSSFFARPTLRGQDVAASPAAADAFCRAQGQERAAYYDQTERAARAIDAEGRMVGDGFVLRDVVCLR